jgi:hypothetical protein
MMWQTGAHKICFGIELEDLQVIGLNMISSINLWQEDLNSILSPKETRSWMTLDQF